MGERGQYRSDEIQLSRHSARRSGFDFSFSLRQYNFRVIDLLRTLIKIYTPAGVIRFQTDQHG